MLTGCYRTIWGARLSGEQSGHSDGQSMIHESHCLFVVLVLLVLVGEFDPTDSHAYLALRLESWV